MPQHISLTLSAVLLSATVISSPSQASILPPTPSEHRDFFAPAQDTGNRWLHRLGGEQRDFSAQISLPLTERIKRRQLASVCFITDAGDCGSLEWEGEGEIDNAEKCRNEGYVDTPCGAGLIPIGTCPYDSNWHSKCGCPSDYDKTCTGADEQGKGEACEGKYQECCNLCTGYDYTADNIPSGYVKSDSCESCDGTKYKARCDVSEGGYMDCGEVVGVGGSCTDDSGTYYKQCSCPLNYEWNDETKTCACATSFKYDCQGSAYADTQTGQTCDDKYSSCDCAEGFEWDGESGMCVCDGVDWCALNQDCTALGYAQQTCPKWSIKCPYDTSFVKCIDCPPSFSEECTGTGQVGEGQSCEGKYRSCTCASGYEWKDGACQQKAPDYSGCTVGALFYSDNTCSNNLESGKTLLGVVIMEKTISANGWIMTVKPIQTNIKWSTEYVNIQEITNCGLTSCLTDIQSSCTNTDIITNYGDSSTYPAAWAAKNYKPSGTPSGKSWCLPSGGLLNKALNNSTNLAKINAGISTAGGIEFGTSSSNGAEYVWSTSECDDYYAWYLEAYTSGSVYMNYYNKDVGSSDHYVRPVLAF